MIFAPNDSVLVYPIGSGFVSIKVLIILFETIFFIQLVATRLLWLGHTSRLLFQKQILRLSTTRFCPSTMLASTEVAPWLFQNSRPKGYSTDLTISLSDLVLHTNVSKKKQIIGVPIDWYKDRPDVSGQAKRHYFRLFFSISLGCCDRGYKDLLCSWNSGENNLEICEFLASGIGRQSRIFTYAGNPENSLCFLLETLVGVGYRYPSRIFGLLPGSQVITILYSEGNSSCFWNFGL